MRIKNKQALTSHGNKEGRKIVTELLDAGLDALDPYYRVKELVKIQDNKIILDNRGFEMKGDPRSGAAVYDLDNYDRIFVIGAAKGIQRAALAMEEVLGDRLTAGHVIGKHGEEIICKKIGVTLAGHPVPDKYCVEGCKKIEALAEDIGERDLVFTIFGSGCGSLFTYPAGDITIKDISDFTYMMQIEKGVPTSDLNSIRTHIDRFKGGRISRLFAKATLVNMVTADPSKMSTPVLRVSYFDMLKNNTFFPTIATASTYKDCIDIINKWDAWDKTPEAIKNHLLAGGAHNENMSIEEYESFNSRFFGLIFKDSTVYPAVREKAAEMGLTCIMLSEYMEAEAREAGFIDGNMALCCERMGEPFKAPIVLMSSGENVVTVGTETGIGGRNQEYCTAAALKISGSDKITIGAVDTDGTDGPGGFKYEGAPECLAGAVVDGCTLNEAREAGINLWDGLKSHGTSQPLWRLGCAVAAEANVSALDLRIIFISG
jgi:glycerate 2-kinase